MNVKSTGSQSSSRAQSPASASLFDDIAVQSYRGMTILKSKVKKPHRRILYLNSYGMAKSWRNILEGVEPGHHLWGCIELVREGYEIAMPEEPQKDSRFYNYRRQDLKHLLFIKSWLGRDGIVYSAHTILFWAPLLRALSLLRCPIVTLLYARGENLRFRSGYHAVIGMTPAAESRARMLTPRAKVVHLTWGVDLPFFPMMEYRPQWFLSCGKTRRDFETLSAASRVCQQPIHLINTELPSDLTWPDNVKRFTGGRNGDWQTVQYDELISNHYSNCIAGLVLLKEDGNDRYAAGFTQLLEAMALGRPVIVTKTGAIAGEIDVEKEGCGLHVPAGDSAALAEAMRSLSQDTARGAAMGQKGRALCESRYNILRFAADLHALFESI